MDKDIKEELMKIAEEFAVEDDSIDERSCEERYDELFKEFEEYTIATQKVLDLYRSELIKRTAKTVELAQINTAIAKKLIKQRKAAKEIQVLWEDFHKELLDIVAPHLSDFTGYSEDCNGFDILEAIRELLNKKGE